MNSMERLRKRLKGEEVDRPPNFDIFMTYAAHHIHETIARFYLDHRVLCRANIALYEALDLDVLQVISDPFREASDMGLQVIFPEDDQPVAERPLLAEPDDIRILRPVKAAAGRRMTDQVEAVRRMVEKSGGEIPVMGWVEGALAEAADLRGVGALLVDLIDRPDWMHEVLEIVTETLIDFARAQIEAGAHIIGLGDAVASQVSTRMFRKFALPYEQRIFAAVHEMGALARLHICGNTSHIVEDMVASGADIIDLDWMVDFHAAAKKIGERAVVCGNFDPVAVMLQGSSQDVYRATTACLDADPRRAISAAGCEIPDLTPFENLLAQKKALEDYNSFH